MKKPLIAKGVSDTARQYITAAYHVLFSVKFMPVLKQMISGASTLVKGCAPFVADLTMKLQTRLGPLSPQDEPVVVLHICGTIADMAKELGDPEVKGDTTRVVAQMMTAVKGMLGGQQQQQPSPMQQLQPQQPPQQAPQ